MKPALRLLVLFAVVATAAHFATIALVPGALMRAVMQRLSAGGTNHMLHGPRADAQHRLVVMPSPDFLYSSCVYDLAQGNLQIHASVPPDTYWSISAYDAQTDNFYAIDDRSAGSAVVDLLLVPPDAPAAPAVDGQRRVQSPSRRGVVLVRTLIDRDARLPELDAIRRKATCTAVPAAQAFSS